jgi:hypothetical protein
MSKKNFSTMVAEFGSNWKKITDAAKTRNASYEAYMGEHLPKKTKKKKK